MGGGERRYEERDRRDDQRRSRDGSRRREYSRYDDRKSDHLYGDRSIDEKLRKIEEKRKEEARDSTAEWGKSPSDSVETSRSRLERIEESKAGPFTRYADDARLNDHQKKDVRWDDPARLFVEDLRPTVQKHRYQPNRFGITPGKRWDGVDRSNGFEAKLFKKRAELKVKTDLGHQYDVENY